MKFLKRNYERKHLKPGALPINENDSSIIDTIECPAQCAEDIVNVAIARQHALNKESINNVNNNQLSSLNHMENNEESSLFLLPNLAEECFTPKRSIVRHYKFKRKSYS